MLHVVDDVYLRLGGDAYAAVLPDLQRDAERAAQERLDALLVDNDAKPLPVKKVTVTSRRHGTRDRRLREGRTASI